MDALENQILGDRRDIGALGGLSAASSGWEQREDPNGPTRP
jgi:hypothetical protein